MKNFIFIILLAACQLHSQDRITGELFATRSEVIAQNGMVASSHPLATQIGIEILKNGGNAIDAAIAVNAALGLMEPTGCGIGGDLFAIVWDPKTKKLHGLNASGPSPQSLSLDYFLDNDYEGIPFYGVLPVSVPGAVAGWFALHRKFGNLSMNQILSPAIQYAEKGFPLTELIAHYMERSVKRFIKSNYPNIKETYLQPNGGKLAVEGEIFKNPLLAKTYRTIANKGEQGFYSGTIARAIADEVQQQGGFLTTEDLSSYKVEWIEPVSINYRGYDIWELPPNGQGIAALQMLKILEGFNFSEIDFGSSEHLHLFTEAKKLAFEDRAKFYADMAFAKVPMKTLLSDAYADQRRALIQDKASMYSACQISAGETIYMTVADKEGYMVSLIQSNYYGMGSGVVPEGVGFMLQNRGALFSLDENHANVYAPGKRPFHTIIPAFVTKDGVPFLSFGVMGGDFQPQGHSQIVMNVIDFGMNIQEAGDAPRWDHKGSSSPRGNKAKNSGKIRVESGISYETIRQLMARGHDVGFATGIYGGYQAILWDAKNKVYRGASESRKDGQVSGY
ncbi:MAG: gamma-glutamyltransferase [Flavobacteriales bacterium]|nr:gamma-glutamyltransferase [Flavobacteriales bacterium]